MKRTTVTTLERKKAKLYDRVTKRLYEMEVYVHGIEPGNEKPLGDCTRADLLRAALLLPGSYYRELADLVGKGSVRESGNTAAILAVIFRSAAEINSKMV
jgi:hypothetical protein